MPTKVTDIDTGKFDVYVGPPRKSNSYASVREGSSWAAGYIKHMGYGDWRDVQAWRYLRNVCIRLLTDPAAREEARKMRGRTLGARGEQGMRCARILATIIDESGILDNDDPEWLRGYRHAIEDKRSPSKLPDAAHDGYQAGSNLVVKREEICGVHEGYEDPAGEGEEDPHYA